MGFGARPPMIRPVVERHLARADALANGLN